MSSDQTEGFTVERGEQQITVRTEALVLSVDLSRGGCLCYLENLQTGTVVVDASRGAPLPGPTFTVCDDYYYTDRHPVMGQETSTHRLAEMGLAEGSFSIESGRGRLATRCRGGKLEVEQVFLLRPDRPLVEMELRVGNATEQNLLVDEVVWDLTNLRLNAEEWTDQYLFPIVSRNTWNRGPFEGKAAKGEFSFVSALTGEEIRGWPYADWAQGEWWLSHGLLDIGLPYVMAHDEEAAEGLWLGVWTTQLNHWVSFDGDLESQTDTLRAKVQYARVLQPGEIQPVAEYQIGLFEGSHYEGMEDYLGWLAREKKWSATEAPEWLGRAIWSEICVDEFARFGTLADLRPRLEELKEQGVNFLHLSGHWVTAYQYPQGPKTEPTYCGAVLIDDNYTVDPLYGGEEGLRQFLGDAHDLGMKVICWITACALPADNDLVYRHPDWWACRKQPEEPQLAEREAAKGFAPDPRVNPRWYTAYGDWVEPNGLGGWRRWLSEQIWRIADLGFDGAFIDSLINLPADYNRYPWYGENGLSLADWAREIRRQIREKYPEFIFVSESRGAQAGHTLDVQMHRAWPDYPPVPAYLGRSLGPADAVDYLRMEQLSMLPGARVTANDLFYFDERICRSLGLPVQGPRRLPWMYYPLLAGHLPRPHFHTKRTLRKGAVNLSDSVQFVDATPEDEWEERYWQDLRRLIQLRQEHPALGDTLVDFDAVEIDLPGVAAFVKRSAVSGESLICLVSFVEEPVQVMVRPARPEDWPEAEAYRIRELYSGQVLADSVPASQLELGFEIVLDICGVAVLQIEPL